MREPRRRRDDAVALRAQPRQGGAELARDALDSSDPMTSGSPAVDEDVPALIGCLKIWQRER
jgi:hypothetical protein